MVLTPNGRKAQHVKGIGFTQVELLVVIGILALLAAILLPSVESARREDKSTRPAAARVRQGDQSVGTASPDKVQTSLAAPKRTDVRATMSTTIPAELVAGVQYAPEPMPILDAQAGDPSAVSRSGPNRNPTNNTVVAGLSPPNDLCTNAVRVEVPSSTAGTTNGAAADSGFPSCSGTSGFLSPGVWYSVVGTGNTMTARTCNAVTSFDTQLSVYCPSCVNPFCVAGNDDSCGPEGFQSQATWCSQLGQVYFILVHGYDDVEFGPFQLDVFDNGAPCNTPAVCGPCDVACSPTAPRENEPDCGLPVDTVNGGCNTTPNAFTPIACGQSYCGTGAFNGASRDTDWYKLTLGAPSPVTWSVTAEFNVVVGIVETGGIDSCEGVAAFRTFAIGSPCSNVEVSSNLPAGTWYLFVAPDFSAVVPCGKEYTARLTCSEPQPGPCCLPMGSCQSLPASQCAASGGTQVDHCPTGGFCVPPGDDCFRTQCGRTLFDFCNDPIPADFFAPGSEPFSGVIILGGPNDGLPDTIVRRFDAMLLDGPPETVPIELVELRLVSCQPITVGIGTAPTQWNVKVDLSPHPVPPGSMMVAKKHANGGVFNAEFNVLPHFVFTQVGNPGNQKILDFGDDGRPPTLFQTTDTPKWVHQLSPAIEHTPCGVNFVPGVEQNPQTLEQCCTETCHANPAGGHNHCTKQCNVCPRGACCNPQNGTCQVVEGAAACPGQYKGDGTNCDDSDGDGIPDWFENNDCCQPSSPCNVASNPNDPDTDDDGISDGAEVAAGCDPCVPGCFLEACCLPGGACRDASPADCQQSGGLSRGSGTRCQGDGNGDGIDDACLDQPCAECGPGDHWIDQTPCPLGDPNVGGVCKFGGVNCLADEDCTGRCRLNPGQNCLTRDDCTGHCEANPGQNCLVNSDCGGVCTVSGVNCATDADCTAAGDVCSGNVCLGRECDNRICNKPNAMGQDTVPSGAVLGLDLDFDCIADTNIIAGGPVTIRKRGPYDDSPSYPGLRPVDGHKDVIDTEIVAMSLTGGGITLKAGVFSATNQALSATNGAIAEQPGNPALADSFFDVFFEIDRGSGPNQYLYNQTPIRVGQVIECVPPKAMYHHLSGCTPLYVSPIPGNAPPIANLVQANHFTYPGCCLPDGRCIDASGPACEDQGGKVVPECLGDQNNNTIDDACERKCEPNEIGTACKPVDCDAAVDRCVPRCVTIDPATGRTRVTQCDCTNVEECHVQLPVGTPNGAAVVAGAGGSCVVPDNGSGTVTLPPTGCEYLSPDEVHQIIDGLPPGTTIELAAIHKDFICNRNPGAGVCSFPMVEDCNDQDPDDPTDGEKECHDSTLQLHLKSAGAPCPGPLCGYDRTVMVPVSFETHTAPRMPGDPVQSFDTDMFRLFGQRVNPGSGDPDFDLLRIVAGTDFGLPSPGHTTLTELPGGNWAVDSFFDITYRIDFVGKPGGPFGGMSGSTTGTIRMQTTPPFKCVGGCAAGEICVEKRTVNPDGSITVCCDCRRLAVEVDDFPSTTAQMELQLPDGSSEVLDLSGPTRVHVFFEGANEGEANDSDGDGLDDVQTEMVSMQLTGVSPTFGPVTVRLHPTKPTRGVIEETANTQLGRLDLPPFAPAGTADSFFDVFFEIDVAGQVLHTQQPKRMSSVITHKPPAPGDTYENPDRIPLLDANGNPTGYFIGAGRHIPRPPCGPNATGTACTPNTCPTPQTFISLSKTEFEALMGGEGKSLKGIEDFEEAIIGDGIKQAFPDPLQGGVPNGPFPNGLAQGNLIIQTNITPGPSPAAPNPSGAPNALFVTGPGFINANSKKVGEDLEVLTDTEASLDLIFTEPNHTGVGFELSHFDGFGQGTWTITVYDKADAIIGVYSLPSVLEPNKSFFGVWSPRTIGRINIYDEGIIPDAVDNIQMWLGAAPIPECLPKCANFNSETGARITACDCAARDECHLEIAPAAPTAVAGAACVVTDNGTGTVDLPPANCGYLSPEDVHMIIDGLPPGTTIRVGAQHMDFFNQVRNPGGSLSGEIEQFDSALLLALDGTGELAGLHRNLGMQVQCETHVAPRTPGDPVQSFDTEMFKLQGQLPPGDPDFDLLRITGGSGFGLPSPGHTTLTQLPGGNWAVDSFFDITYRIDFVGAPGGPLGGMSGSTTGTIRMQTTPPFKCVGGCPSGEVCVPNRTVNPDGTLSVCCECHLPCGSELAGDCFEPHPTPSCNKAECCECVCAQNPSCCKDGWSQECAELAREICVQPTVVKWESVVNHTPNLPIDVALDIPDTGLFSEPRGAVRKLVVTFDRPIDPASAVVENINLCGLKPGTTPGAFVDVDLSGITMAVNLTDGNTKMVISFNPGLPNYAKYHISLKGLRGRCGALVKPGTGGLSRIFTALQYDAAGGGDRRVNATDLGLIRSLVGTNPIDPGILNHVRADGNNDGRVNATDLGGARGRVGNDARDIPDPACP